MHQNALLLYKNQPARLVNFGDRIEIELPDGERARVRPKDVIELHPGPLLRLADLTPPPSGELQAAWQMLAGGETTLDELTELAFGEITPQTIWAAWQCVAAGEWFDGTPDHVRARTPESVEHRRQEREQAAEAKRAQAEALARLAAGSYLPADEPALTEVESLALGYSDHAATLRALHRPETPETAHALLLDTGYWTTMRNPHPSRLGFDLHAQAVPPPVPSLPIEHRLDLTHLTTYAIDDIETDVPDDALSIDGDHIWVHIADAAALIHPGDALDQWAQERGLTLHLPEGALHLLPQPVIDILGLGLQEISPALSFELFVDQTGAVELLRIVPTSVRVTRLTYESASARIPSDATLSALQDQLDRARALRNRSAVQIDFPEAQISVDGNGVISIRPLETLAARTLVEEAMIATGGSVARWASDHDLPMPFSAQDAPDSAAEAAAATAAPSTLSQMFAVRRTLKRSRYQTAPAGHFGLGLPAYCQVTSPLRRALDLAAHQQLRGWLLSGVPVLSTEDLTQRIAAIDAINSAMRQAEIYSERHWTLVYLLQHPDWQGEGIVMDVRGAMALVTIPSLAMEARVYPPRPVTLDEHLTLQVDKVRLAERDASFKVIL